MAYRVSAIVPAYNEEKKIAGVLEKLVLSKHIHEVICVNDGSSDKTQEIAKRCGAQVINLLRNNGKAYAIACGVLAAKGDIVVFVDADITGLNDLVIEKLVEPLKSGEYDVAIGYRATAFEGLFFKPFSGERAYFRKDLLPHLKKFEKKGYGLEMYLNYAFKDKRVKIFPTKGIKNSLKQDKQSFLAATKLDIKEVSDIIFEALRQRNNFPSYFLNSFLCPFYVPKPAGNFIFGRILFLLLIPTFVISVLSISSFNVSVNTSINKEIIDKSISSYKRYESVLISLKDRLVFPPKHNLTNGFFPS